MLMTNDPKQFWKRDVTLMKRELSSGYVIVGNQNEIEAASDPIKTILYETKTKRKRKRKVG